MEPVYRKYSNNIRFFKIVASDTFEELQIIGSKFQQFQIKATTYPERLFIQDLVACNFDGIEKISEKDFNTTLSKLQNNSIEIKPHQN